MAASQSIAKPVSSLVARKDSAKEGTTPPVADATTAVSQKAADRQRILVARCARRWRRATLEAKWAAKWGASAVPSANQKSSGWFSSSLKHGAFNRIQ